MWSCRLTCDITMCGCVHVCVCVCKHRNSIQLHCKQFDGLRFCVSYHYHNGLQIELQEDSSLWRGGGGGGGWGGATSSSSKPFLFV